MINIKGFNFKNRQWKPKVLVTNKNIPDAAISILRKKCEVIICENESRDEILNKANGVDGIIWATHEKIDKEALIAAGPELKSISVFSVGLDYVDVLEIRNRKIPLGYTPNVLSDAVADIAVGLAIAASRRFHESRLKIIDSKWDMSPQWMLGVDIRGSTVGIVGFGGIGQTIAKRLSGFDVGQYLYCGHSEKSEAAKVGAKLVNFDELIRQSDFVFIACPLTSETKHLFNAEAFSKMKSTSVLVNVARGLVVDQEALVHALKSGEIFAAGLDVMYPEPLPANNCLLNLYNCVITPHLGSATVKTRDNMAIVAALNVLAGLAGEKMHSPVY